MSWRGPMNSHARSCVWVLATGCLAARSSRRSASTRTSRQHSLPGGHPRSGGLLRAGGRLRRGGLEPRQALTRLPRREPCPPPQHRKIVSPCSALRRARSCVVRPPGTKERPPSPGKRPLDEASSPPATRSTVAHQAAAFGAMVRQSGGENRKARGRRIPAVYASVYEPCEGRTLWAFAYICAWCRLGHLGRAKSEAEVAGPRRSRCGRLVFVRAARVYRSRAAA
jgi:hypothetical protein